MKESQAFCKGSAPSDQMAIGPALRGLVKGAHDAVHSPPDARGPREFRLDAGVENGAFIQRINLRMLIMPDSGTAVVVGYRRTGAATRL